MSEAEALSLSAAEQGRLLRQRWVGRVLAPLWVPLASVVLRFGFGYRIAAVRELRERYAAERRESDAPLLLCANHLTLIDSFLVAWALGTPGSYVRDFGALPWNTPERANFAASWWLRLGTYLMKCVPISRGGDRNEIAASLARVAYLLRSGDVTLIFPEGGRSRSGRVEIESAAYGVGRLVKAVPGCRVLCVYLRGRGQGTWSSFPRRGEVFDVSLASIEPKSDRAGLRGSLEIARQIVGQLARMEQEALA